MGNYRSISIVPIFSKLTEKLLHEQLVGYAETNQLFNPMQFGFRTGKSTVLAVQELVNYIIGCSEKGNDTASIFCDLSKAFDCVSPCILLEKLKYYGICTVTQTAG